MKIGSISGVVKFPFRLLASLLYFISGMIFSLAEACTWVVEGPRVVPVNLPPTPDNSAQPNSDTHAKDVKMLVDLFVENEILFSEVVIQMARETHKSAHVKPNKSRTANSMENDNPIISGTKIFPVPAFLKSASAEITTDTPSEKGHVSGNKTEAGGYNES